MSRFRPDLLPTLVVLALLPLLIGLGFWQLARAEDKRALLASYEARRSAPASDLNRLEHSTDPAYRRVRLHGHFDAQYSLLLDNRMRDGRAGVELLQPFYDQASNLWLLLNRGWLPWPDRRIAPAFTTPPGTQELEAWIYVPLGAAFQLHADRPGGAWPRLITAVEPRALWQQLGRAGLPYELRIQPGLAAYRADWPVVAMAPEKHQAYAVQWFALAAALCGLFIYFGLHNARENQHGRRHESSHQHS
ncbi:SURF1 family protein [Pseudomonas cavernae]|uniref:SURF1-like protein n=1 Tax=Pseudomonas cavernae TaxID=2320867 RepID=A0A385YVN3_9PSED|nr:SURF1 family protein [Pseudomonas cavernae]AYC30919.1 SURF1 family protein [Pseudomonas cavernae]